LLYWARSALHEVSRGSVMSVVDRYFIRVAASLTTSEPGLALVGVRE
jgi:hypothetical protein